MSNPFDFAKSINDTKVDLIREGYEEEGDYIPFLMNRNFSLFNDTIFHANAMNMVPHLSKQMQYDYLRIAIKKRNRFQKWPKRVVDEDIENIRNFYNINKVEAFHILKLLSKDQLIEIKTIMDNNNKGET